MSHLTLVQLVIPSAVALIQTLVETGLECVQRTEFRTDDGKSHAVDVVVKDPANGAQVGVRIDAKPARTDSPLTDSSRPGSIRRTGAPTDVRPTWPPGAAASVLSTRRSVRS